MYGVTPPGLTFRPRGGAWAALVEKRRQHEWESISGAMPAARPATAMRAVHDAGAAQWYAVQIRYRFEKRAAAQLQRNGVEAFLPLRVELRQWSDRRKPIEVPLFPGYAFVRVDQSFALRLQVLHTAGLTRFVRFAGEPVMIPAKQIDDLKKLLAQKVPCSLYPFLKVGERVRVRGGCLDGLEGIIDQREPGNLVISIDCIQKSVAITIEGYELEMI